MAIDRLAWPLLLAVAVSGCAVGPNFKQPAWYSPRSWFAGRPKLAADLPSEPVQAPVDVAWWNLFDDPELTSLENRVAASNLDVRLSAIRLYESRAQRGITDADAFPTLNANGSYTRERISKEGAVSVFSGGSGGGGSGGSSGGGASVNTQANGVGGRSGPIPSSAVGGGSSIRPFDLYQYGFDASWELDFWGRVRRAVESADATVLASADARRQQLLTSLAEGARDYISLRGTQTQLRIARENLGTEQRSLSLTQSRAQAGLVTQLDVANAQAQVSTTASQIPQLEQSEAQSINALSLLLGEAPNALRAELIEPKPVPPVPPTVPVGLPAELARRRPDVRQAEEQLHAATASVGVAVADFYPQITLSGSFSFQALQLSTLGVWDARQYQIGPAFTLPIFQGGRLRATLVLRKAQEQEAYIKYQQTVLQAWHDVDNALTAYGAEQRRQALLASAVQADSSALSLAQSQYQQGLVDFLNVLDAQRTLLSAQLSLANSETTVSTNLVALYNALGGGWQEAFPASGELSGSGKPLTEAKAD